MKKTDLAYIAGIIDGEGCINTQRQVSKSGLIRYNIQLSIQMTDRAILEFVQYHLGGNIHDDRRKRKTDEWKWKTLYRWCLTGNSLIATLKSLKPFLLLKRERVEIALRILTSHPYWKHYTPMERFLQEADALAINKLNKKGKT